VLVASGDSPHTVLSLSNIQFSYPVGGFSLAVPQLQVTAGESLAVIGPSGSGKTTLLNLIAGILQPDAGKVSLDGRELGLLDDRALRNLRLTRFGLIFQEFELLEYLDVLDNVLLPYRVGAELQLTAEVRRLACQLLEQVGLAAKQKRYPQDLSQGERQRVALCRALLTRPALILADEPTGNLDPANKNVAMDFLFDYVREHDAALITVTHDHQLIERFDRVIDFQEFIPQAEVAA
jgi:putative ABC transport system ATP-binding protein